MRRAVPIVSLVIALVLAVVPAAGADEVSIESVPRLLATQLNVEKSCGGMQITATDRRQITATSTYDERDLVSRRITARQVTVFEWVNAGSTPIAIETLGTRTITRNADGTYTLELRGTGYWHDDGSLSGDPQLVRFTGTITSIGLYDAGTFTFSPIETAITGITAPICEMLVLGLKARH